MPSDYGALGYAGVRSVLMAVQQANSVETEKVVDTLATLKYDIYKGPEHVRACDHQAVQPVFIIESKDKSSSPYDVFDIVQTDPADEADLKSCAEEGHS